MKITKSRTKPEKTVESAHGSVEAKSPAPPSKKPGKSVTAKSPGKKPRASVAAKSPGKKPRAEIEAKSPTLEEIRVRAYEIFESRQDDTGSPLLDWLDAERELEHRSNR